MLNFLKSRAITLIALLLTILGYIMFSLNTGEYTGSAVTVLSVVTMVALVILLFGDVFSLAPIAACAMSFASFIVVILSQMSNIAMATTGVLLGTAIPATFYVSAVCYFLAVILSLIRVYKKQKPVRS